MVMSGSKKCFWCYFSRSHRKLVIRCGWKWQNDIYFDTLYFEKTLEWCYLISPKIHWSKMREASFRASWSPIWQEMLSTVSLSSLPHTASRGHDTHVILVGKWAISIKDQGHALGKATEWWLMYLCVCVPRSVHPSCVVIALTWLRNNF